MPALSSTRCDARLLGGRQLSGAADNGSGMRSPSSISGHERPLGGRRVGGITEDASGMGFFPLRRGKGATT
jgi:hypothetical protein